MSRSTQNRLKVAVGLIIHPENKKILTALRPLHLPQGGLWEFPGGKFENTERPLEALTRELYEEIGIDVLNAIPLLCIEHNYNTQNTKAICLTELHVWEVIRYNGIPFGREGQEIRWVSLDELSQLALPEGNQKIIEFIRSNK